MICEVLQNRLLALPDLDRLPDELRRHLDGCDACRSFRQRAVRLDHLLTQLPVPSDSESGKTSFLSELSALATPRRAADTTSYRLPGWKTVSGLAASLLIGVGIWTMNSRPNPAPAPEVAGLRHDLLGKEVRHLVALSSANTPSQRLTVWSEVAGDVRKETRALYQVAPAEEMHSLARMYDKAVRQGILHQVNLLAQYPMPASEREALISTVSARLQAAESEANRLADQAPPQSVSPLRAMAESARDGRLQLRGGAAR